MYIRGSWRAQARFMQYYKKAVEEQSVQGTFNRTFAVCQWLLPRGRKGFKKTPLSPFCQNKQQNITHRHILVHLRHHTRAARVYVAVGDQSLSHPPGDFIQVKAFIAALRCLHMIIGRPRQNYIRYYNKAANAHKGHIQPQSRQRQPL